MLHSLKYFFDKFEPRPKWNVKGPEVQRTFYHAHFLESAKSKRPQNSNILFESIGSFQLLELPMLKIDSIVILVDAWLLPESGY